MGIPVIVDAASGPIGRRGGWLSQPACTRNFWVRSSRDCSSV